MISKTSEVGLDNMTGSVVVVAAVVVAVVVVAVVVVAVVLSANPFVLNKKSDLSVLFKPCGISLKVRN